MNEIRPIYKRLLLAAIVIYVIGVGLMLADIYSKIGEIEHSLVHKGSAHVHKH